MIDLNAVLTNLFSWLAVAGVSAVISTCLAVLLLRGRVTALSHELRDIAASHGRLEERVQSMLIDCPRAMAQVITKDEIIRVHGAINEMAQRMLDKLDEIDRQGEVRASKAHGRINALEAQLGELRGRIHA